MDDDWFVDYDVERLKGLLTDLTKGRGVLHELPKVGARTSLVLIPRSGSSGSPVFVTVTGDEAVLTAGMGATTQLSCTDVGDEDHVVEVVAAIMDVGATEYRFHSDEDTPTRTGLRIVGTFGELAVNTDDAVLMRPLQAW